MTFDPLGFEQRARKLAREGARRIDLTARLRRLEGQGHVRLRWFSPWHVRINPTARKLQVDFWPGKDRWVSLPGTWKRDGWAELLEFLEIPQDARVLDSEVVQ